MKITDIEVNESIEIGDNFDIELGNTIIESRVVGFMDDGVILEADDKALALLGISGALLESVDITEVSLGDYSKKAQISKALAQIDQKFYPDKPGSEQTIAKRTRGLERAKVRNDQARAKYAAQAQQDRAKAIAKDRENLPTLEKYLAQLQSEFDPYYEYSDDHSVWTRNRELKAKISNLQQRIKDAKGVTEGDDDSFTKPAIIMRASPKAMAKAQEILQKQADKNVISMAKIAGTTPSQGVTESKSFGPENPYEVKPGEDFSLVFKPGKRSGVHYHMNSGMVADPFYFVLNGKLYSVTNQGDGIPKEVQQGVAEGLNDKKSTVTTFVTGCDWDKVVEWLEKNIGQTTLKSPNYINGWHGQGWALFLNPSRYEPGKLAFQVRANTDLSEEELKSQIEMFCKGVAEGTNVTDYNPKSQGGTRKELLAKYHNTKDPKDAEAARKAGATQKELRGVAEGYDNVGNKIKALYQKIYDQGDDSIDYMYHESPVFAQIWDEYEGDLDSIIAEVDPSELQVIANELEAYLHGPGLTEVYAPAVGGKDFDQYTPAVDAAMKKHNAEKALYKAANPKDDPTGALQQKGFDRAQAVNQRLITKQALGKIKANENINEGMWDKIKDFGQAMGHIGGELKRTMTTPSTSNTGQKFGKGQATPGGPLGPIARYQNRNKNEGVSEGRMKEQMHTDAERMELADFIDKYGNEDWVKEFWQNVNADINEAKYQGREVPLGKPMAGDVKKSKVYVRGPKGNVVKVNFGDKNMRIKKSNPKRRKSFRARHNCANPGPRWKARYWSCRAW